MRIDDNNINKKWTCLEIFKCFKIDSKADFTFNRPEEDGIWKTLNTEWAMDYWHQKGAPKDKLLIGQWKLNRHDKFTSPQKCLQKLLQ